MSKDVRERILSRIREANRDREPISHPGSLPEALEPPGAFGDAGRTDPVGAFEDRLRAAGGEVVRLADEAATRRWLEDFASEFESMSVCTGVPDALQTGSPRGTTYRSHAWGVGGGGSRRSDRLASSFLQGRPAAADPPPGSPRLGASPGRTHDVG